jgi:hypothetical protein
MNVKVKVKVPCNRPKGSEGGRGIALLFLDLGARRGWVVSTTPQPLYPRERPGTLGLGGPQSQSGQVRKISPPPEFDPQTVQPIVGRYTN